MNDYTNINLNAVTVLYKTYRDYIIPFGIIILSIILFVNFVIPQINDMLKLQKTIQVESEKLRNLRSNLALLNGVNDSDITFREDVALGALPKRKNFEGVLNAIQISAQASNVVIGDYAFTVGDISSKSAQIEGVSGYPSLELNLNITGGIDGSLKFMEELYKTAPLAEVITIKTSGEMSTIKALFYYKPISVITVDYDSSIDGLKSDDISLLDEISRWNNFIQGGIAPLPLNQSNFRKNPFE